MNQWEFIFHGAELFILAFGVAVPIILSSLRIRSILKDFPPHRHIGSRIFYPKNYEPSKAGEMERNGG
jgi:hypothetical protein